MKSVKLWRTVVVLATLSVLVGAAAHRTSPGTAASCSFVVPSEPPSYDAHREETFGVMHPMAPHYNTLLRVDPNDKTGTKPVGRPGGVVDDLEGRARLHVQAPAGREVPRRQRR